MQIWMKSVILSLVVWIFAYSHCEITKNEKSLCFCAMNKSFRPATDVGGNTGVLERSGNIKGTRIGKLQQKYCFVFRFC